MGFRFMIQSRNLFPVQRLEDTLNFGAEEGTLVIQCLIRFYEQRFGVMKLRTLGSRGPHTAKDEWDGDAGEAFLLRRTCHNERAGRAEQSKIWFALQGLLAHDSACALVCTSIY